MTFLGGFMFNELMGAFLEGKCKGVRVTCDHKLYHISIFDNILDISIGLDYKDLSLRFNLETKNVEFVDIPAEMISEYNDSGYNKFKVAFTLKHGLWPVPEEFEIFIEDTLANLTDTSTNENIESIRKICGALFRNHCRNSTTSNPPTHIKNILKSTSISVSKIINENTLAIVYKNSNYVLLVDVRYNRYSFNVASRTVPMDKLDTIDRSNNIVVIID